MPNKVVSIKTLKKELYNMNIEHASN